VIPLEEPLDWAANLGTAALRTTAAVINVRMVRLP
jgi:hypothetical protein